MKFSFTIFKIFPQKILFICPEDNFVGRWFCREIDISNLNKMKSIFKENLLTLELNPAVCVAVVWGYLEESRSQMLASQSLADHQVLLFVQPRQ